MTAAASRPQSAGSTSLSRGRTKGGRREAELSVARPLATLELWSRILTAGLEVDWQPVRETPAIRPLEPGVPYPWPWAQLEQHITETVLEAELLR